MSIFYFNTVKPSQVFKESKKTLCLKDNLCEVMLTILSVLVYKFNLIFIKDFTFNFFK